MSLWHYYFGLPYRQPNCPHCFNFAQVVPRDLVVVGGSGSKVSFTCIETTAYGPAFFQGDNALQAEALIVIPFLFLQIVIPFLNKVSMIW